MDFATKSASLSPHKENPYRPYKFYEGAPVSTVPIACQVATTPSATPYTTAPASAPTYAKHCYLTLRLFPFHCLNFVLGTAAFCIEVTGVCLAVGLLPLCCLGIPTYFIVLHITHVLTLADVALANTITPTHATARLDVSDTASDDDHANTRLRIAPNLTSVSLRSTGVVVYFATVKFALAIASAVVVSLPFLPIASQITASTSSSSSDHETYTAGWEVHSFNFSTHPVGYFLTCIGFIVGGIALMHVVGIVSRKTTRAVCCSKPKHSVTVAMAV